MNIHGFKIEDYDLLEQGDEPLEHPVVLHLEDPEEADDVIGGETGTFVDVRIDKDGIRLIRSDNDPEHWEGSKGVLSERFLPWSEILPDYGGHDKR